MAPPITRGIDYLGRYPKNMLNFFAAIVCGFLAGLGVGGGSLLMLWLTIFTGTPYPQARIINLLFFLPSAAIASIFRWKQGTLKLRRILPAFIAGCIAAAICSVLSRFLELEILQKMFGYLLLITGIREILYRPK